MSKTSSEPTTRILVADDEKLLVESYEALLGRDYDVETVTDGAGALDTIDDSFDVVILDRRMPRYTGEEILHEIRRRDLDCRVIICSGVEPGTDILGMDFDDYLVKPVGNEEIVSAVQRQIRLIGYDDEVRRYYALRAKRRVLEETNNRSVGKSDHDIQRLRERIADIEQSLNPPRIDQRRPA